MDDLKQSVTLWIRDLKQGDDEAARKIWERYFQRLVGVAQRRLGSAPRRVADEEDVAVSAFHSLCDGAANGRFDQLTNRDDLWKLLVAVTRMKVVDQVRRQTAKKRGGTDVRGESIVAGMDGEAGGLDRFLSVDPTPEFLTTLEEQRELLFDALPDESQQKVARLRMDGFMNEEIAAQLNMSLRSVERKLKVIRDTWTQELDESFA